MSFFNIINFCGRSSLQRGNSQNTETELPLIPKKTPLGPHFSSLFEELYLKIFQKLSAEDLLNVSMTDHRCYRISCDDSLWAPFCREIGIKISDENEISLRVLYRERILESDRNLIRHIIPYASVRDFLNMMNLKIGEIEKLNNEEIHLKPSPKYSLRKSEIDSARQKKINELKADKNEEILKLKKVYARINKKFEGALFVSNKKIRKIAELLEKQVALYTAEEKSFYYLTLSWQRLYRNERAQRLYLWAAQYGNVVTLHGLVEQNRALVPSQEMKNRFACPLCQTIERGDPAMMEYLLTQGNFIPSSKDLEISLKKRDARCVDLLLKNNAPISARHFFLSHYYDVGLRKLCDAVITRDEFPKDWDKKSLAFLKRAVNKGMKHPLLFLTPEEEETLSDEEIEKFEESIKAQFELISKMIEREQTLTK